MERKTGVSGPAGRVPVATLRYLVELNLWRPSPAAMIGCESGAR
jgi:hypothetical protein